MATLQAYHRGVRDLKIATWNSEGSYGTAYDVKGARTANLAWVVESDSIRGDDVDLANDTKIVAATLSIAQASLDLIVVDMITGGTLISNANYYDLKVGEDDVVPYVCIIGRVVGAGGVGDLHFMLPKAMLSGNVQFSAGVDSWMIPTADFRGVHEGATNGMLRLRHFVNPTALTLPLATS